MSKGMSNRMLSKLAAAGVVSALIATACGSSSSGSSNAKSAPSSPASNAGGGSSGGGSKTFKVGLLGVLSGPIALPSFTNGAVAYFKSANAAGGVGGYQFSWKLVDDANNGPQAVSQARSLVQGDGVQALIGAGSGPVTALKAIAPSLGVPVVMGGDGALFAPPVSNMFTTTPDYYSTWEFAADIAKSHLNSSKIGLIYSNDAFGTPAQTALSSYAPKKGITLVSSVAIPTGTTNFVPIVQKMKDANAPVVVLALQAQLITGVIKTAENIGYAPKWIANWGAEGPPVVAALGAQQMASVTSFDFVPPLSSTAPGTVAYKTGMQKYDPADMTDAFAQYGWDYGALIADALKAVTAQHKAVNNSDMIAAIDSLSNQQVGTVPSVTYSSSQHYGVQSLVALQYSNGQWVTDGSFQQAPPPPAGS